jgi:hypothetical protein
LLQHKDVVKTGMMNTKQVAERIEKEILPPRGWHKTKASNTGADAGADEAQVEHFVIDNLPKATQSIEKLTEKIRLKTGIVISEVYLRIADDASFHFLVLVDESVFHSPEIAAAHILAEELEKSTTSYDIHITFNVQKEFDKLNSHEEGNYLLKRVLVP